MAAHQQARIHAAMIEMATERGYEGVTLRELVGLAGVSTRTFYKHYSGKEECFLWASELILRRILSHVLDAQMQTPAWDDRVRITMRVLLEQLARDPQAALLLLVEARTAGLPGRAQMRRTGLVLEARFRSCFDREPSNEEMPAVLIEAIVVGLLSVARNRLVEARSAELPALAEGLASWALAIYATAPELLAGSNRRDPRGEAAVHPLASSSAAEGAVRSLALAGDRSLLLAALHETLTATGGGADEPDA